MSGLLSIIQTLDVSIYFFDQLAYYRSASRIRCSEYCLLSLTRGDFVANKRHINQGVVAANGASQQSSSSYNRRIVLDVIRRAGSASRKEIVDLVSLSPQTVANITYELQSAGLIKTGRIKSRKSRGQPPISFSLNANGGASIGVSLEPGYAKAALVDLAGEVIVCREAAIAGDDQASCLQVVLGLTDSIIKDYPGKRVWGIGVALPGPLHIDDNDLLGPTAFAKWQDHAIFNALHQRSGLSVYYSVDSIAGALGEILYGAAKQLNDFYYLHFGVGLGGVLVPAQSVYQGFNGNATELGHVPIVPNGESCYCGNRGCLERYVSLHALKEALFIKDNTVLNKDLINTLLTNNNEDLNKWIQSAGQVFRSAVCFIENSLDPATIIIGGTAPTALIEKLLDATHPLLKSVRSHVDSLFPRLQMAEHGEDSSMLGAAALPIYEMTSPRMSAMQNSLQRSSEIGDVLGLYSTKKVSRL